jgi:predicted transcriptional regulator
MRKAESTTNVTIRLRSTLLKRVRQRAREQQTSANRLVEQAVEAAFGGRQSGGYLRINEAARTASAQPPGEPFVRLPLDDLHEDDA